MRRAVFSWVLLGVSVGFLEPAQASAAPDQDLSNYYSIHEVSAVSGLQEPLRALAAFVEEQVLDLMRFDHHPRPFPVPRDPYNRMNHFGGWVDDPRDDNCYNTRAKVLIRDSSRPVRFNPGNPCSVMSGRWNEPYAGRQQTEATEVQIDHVVALKNAYISGAHRWDFKTRCLYANYLGNAFHLLPVDKTENMRKGDRTPSDWMPSDARNHCGHLANWLRIKLIWGLVLGDRETRAVIAQARSAGCDRRLFVFTRLELAQQRGIIGRNLELCEKLRPGSGDEG